MGPTVKPPLHPLWVLLIAVLLPGVGQVINNTPKRGLMFLFFIMSMGWVTLHLAPPEASFGPPEPARPQHGGLHLVHDRHRLGLESRGDRNPAYAGERQGA